MALNRGAERGANIGHAGCLFRVMLGATPRTILLLATGLSGAGCTLANDGARAFSGCAAGETCSNETPDGLVFISPVNFASLTKTNEGLLCFAANSGGLPVAGAPWSFTVSSGLQILKECQFAASWGHLAAFFAGSWGHPICSIMGPPARGA
jgi:hypothetical protein